MNEWGIIMKQLPKLIAAVFLAVLLCIPAAFAVFYYTQPMADVSYELFRFADDVKNTGMAETDGLFIPKKRARRRSWFQMVPEDIPDFLIPGRLFIIQKN